MKNLSWGIIVLIMSSVCHASHSIRVATFNVSMEADNYRDENHPIDPEALFKQLSLSGHPSQSGHPQIRNIAEIIQRTRPDIILLNEFDYTADPQKGAKAFINNFLLVSQNGQKPIDFPYFYTTEVNTGVASEHDLNADGIVESAGNDAFGYGQYPGQYGMLLLSRFPIQIEQIRTFQRFLWKDMPSNLMTSVLRPDGSQWYAEDAQKVMRLSSKSHWDIPVKIGNTVVNVLASHPTPPVFDGPENRNGKRNHDEIRFWHDYIRSCKQAQYIYDDNGGKGGFEGGRFVILGDLNASESEGDGMRSMIADLLHHPLIAQSPIPSSDGGLANRADNPLAAFHTASWGMRADYVLPSKQGMNVAGSGVFWPTSESDLAYLVKDRQASSDHRLVWVDLTLHD